MLSINYLLLSKLQLPDLIKLKPLLFLIVLYPPEQAQACPKNIQTPYKLPHQTILSLAKQPHQFCIKLIHCTNHMINFSLITTSISVSHLAISTGPSTSSKVLTFQEAKFYTLNFCVKLVQSAHGRW